MKNFIYSTICLIIAGAIFFGAFLMTPDEWTAITDWVLEHGMKYPVSAFIACVAAIVLLAFCSLTLGDRGNKR